MFIAFSFLVIITSWLIGAQPVFIFFYVILGAFGIYLSMAISNAWEALFVNPMLLAILSEFPITDNLMTYLPSYITAVFMIGLFVTFAKVATVQK
jgi:hypothetical protein